MMQLIDVSVALGVFFFLTLGAHGSPIESELVERQNSFFAVAGATGNTSPRLEVRDLANNADQWNLFVLAMQRFQAKPQSDKLSFYQVSGIHGRPYVNWDGVGPYSSSPWWPGYCPHSSNLFGSWHRPYLSLYEQLILQYANEIINESPASSRKTRYQDAVKTLRFPYWDWAQRTNTIIPSFLSQATIQVTFPQNDTSRSIPNPLYAYRFQVVPDNNFESNFASNRQTTRSANAETNLQNSYTSRRNTLLTLFSRNQPYNNFSTDANGNRSPNLEGVHNGVHVDIGGYMQQIAYSALDPIFAMHHANVDRVIAIWQRLYPNSWVAPAPQGAGTRTVAPFTSQDANSALTPFHRDTRGTFWTSNAVRDTASLGYTYPDLVGVSNSQLTTNLNRLYGNSATNTALRASGDGNAASTTYDWMAQITLDKSVLGGQSYAVQFTLDGQYVASFAALAVPPSPGAKATSVTSSGTVMLTDTLAQRGIDTSDFEATTVYLNEHLKWQVVQNNAVIANVPRLNVTIASAEVQPAKAQNQFATWLEQPQAIDNTTTSSL